MIILVVILLYVNLRNEQYQYVNDPLSMSLSQLNGNAKVPVAPKMGYDLPVWMENGLFLVFSFALCCFQVRLANLSMEYFMTNELVS